MKKLLTTYPQQINDSVVVTRITPASRESSTAETKEKPVEVTHELIAKKDLQSILQSPQEPTTYDQRKQDTIKAREVLLGIKLMLSNRPS